MNYLVTYLYLLLLLSVRFSQVYCSLSISHLLILIQLMTREVSLYFMKWLRLFFLFFLGSFVNVYRIEQCTAKNSEHTSVCDVVLSIIEGDVLRHCLYQRYVFVCLLLLHLLLSIYLMDEFLKRLLAYLLVRQLLLVAHGLEGLDQTPEPICLIGADVDLLEELIECIHSFTS